MSFGLAILILGFIYLLIASPRFRRIAAVGLGVTVAIVLILVGLYEQHTAAENRRREVAKSYIKTAQIELVDPRVSFSTYDGRPDRMTGRVRNNSGYDLDSVEVRLVFQDCATQNQCETVDDEKLEIRASVPARQSRDFDQYVIGSKLSPKGQINWRYEVISVSAHVD
jgi:hypothetical protein